MFVTTLVGAGIRHRRIIALICIVVVLALSLQLLQSCGPQVGPNFEISNVHLSDFDIQRFDQKDPQLLNYIKAHHLEAPSIPPHKGRIHGGGEVYIEDKIKMVFGNKRGGFFVECGAYNGVYSHTVFLERELGWSGLLVECHPVLFAQIKKLHRNAFLADVCLSIFDHPQKVEFVIMDGDMGSSTSEDELKNFQNYKNGSTFERLNVTSIPFYSLLAATGVSTVDVVVLDVQGIEDKVLRHFPFDLILVKMWIVEIALQSKEELDEMRNIMVQNGYIQCIPTKEGYDDIYLHNSVKPFSQQIFPLNKL